MLSLSKHEGAEAGVLSKSQTLQWTGYSFTAPVIEET